MGDSNIRKSTPSPRRKHKKKRAIWIIPTAAVALLLLLGAIGYNIYSHNTYTIYPNTDRTEWYETLEYGSTFTVPVLTGEARGSILHYWDETITYTERYNNLNEDKLGLYTIRLVAKYKDASSEIAIHVKVEDHMAPEITLVSDPNHYTHPNESYEEEGYSAIDNYDGDISAYVKSEERNGIVYYTSCDSSGNISTAERVIRYLDDVPPVLTLSGEDTIYLEYGETYEEPGFEATDDCDGLITDRVEVTNPVDCFTLGTYTVKYHVEDNYGNAADATRTVIVRDLGNPVINLSGGTVYVKLGKDYNEKGYSAFDSCDGDLTSKVQVSGNVNTGKKGVYTLNYSVKDSSGNTAYASRKVYVYEKQATNNVVNPGEKVVYLTFDDGPGPYTEKLLDVLDKYNVKATFFVTNQMSKYTDWITEEYKRGHTVGLHTYDHAYADVYQSEEAYYADLEKIDKLVYKKTGIHATIIRFPGGSSNTTSKQYNKGIMTRLTESVGKMGYLYCDWNVTSGDGDSSISRRKVFKNVTEGIQTKDVSIVLQHDLAKGSVDAVEEIIVWGLANGYTFLPLDETSPMYHHPVNN